MIKGLALLTIFYLIYWSSASCQLSSPEVIATAGGFFTGTSLTQSWTIGESITETFSGSSIIATQGFQQPGNELAKLLRGTLVYKNSVATPMNNVNVLLKEVGQIIAQKTTDESGFFLFTDPPNGNFTLDAACNKKWGGGNALDALLIMKHFVGISYLSGLNMEAADVDGSGYINAIDALEVMNRFVGLSGPFVSGDWIFEHPDVSILGNHTQTVNFKGLCYGDVDGSYTPPNIKVEPTLEMVYHGLQKVNSNQIIKVPIRVT
jgi:hypothetical protein